MNSTENKTGLPRKVRKRPVLWIGLVLILGAAMFYFSGAFEPQTTETAYHEVKRGDFLVSIVEGGTLEAVNEVVIRNEVDGTSRVIYIVPEGTYVKTGDLLVELDTGEAEAEVNQQEISYEKAKSTYTQAEKDLEIQKSVIQSSVDSANLGVEFAQIDLEKYMKGLRLQELRNAEIDITTATSDLLLSKDNLEWSEKLFDQGFETKNAVDQGRNNVLDLTLRLEKAQTNLWVLKTFDHPKMIRQYESTFEEATNELARVIAQGEGKLIQLQTDLLTQSNSLALIKRKLENDKEQLVKSKVYAPQEGLVVYAITQSRFSSQSMIEEGAMVRMRQELIKLPDTSEMKVEIKVHESHVNKVHPGQAAFVVLDNLPDERFKAEVTKVGVLPDTQSRFGNPNLKVYKTEVRIKDELAEVKPGVSARAEIIITNVPQAITVPIQSVTTLKGQTVAFVKIGGSAEPVPVEVGLFNTKFIQVVSGLKEGDLVLLSPPYDIQEKDLGGAIVGEDEELPPDALKPTLPNTGGGPAQAQPQGINPDRSGLPQRPGESSRQGPGQGEERPGGRRAGPNRADVMKQFDKDGDGKLDETEQNAMREEMKKRFGGRERRNRPEQ